MSEQIEKLSAMLGRKPAQVQQDLRVCKKMLDDPIWAINEFFVKGKGWFYDPLVKFQVDGAKRFFNDDPLQLEIWPRGHTKTTLFSRACCALEVAMGISPYTVIFSSTSDNSAGNRQAFETIFQKELFRDLQWFLNYWQGVEIADVKSKEITLSNGGIIEFKSMFGESRGLNRQGRPYRIHLDDVLPTDAATSFATREEVTDRYFSMIRPMGEAGSKISIVGTVMHRDDLLWKIATNKIEGFTTQVLSAFNEDTREVIWPERWTYEDLTHIRDAEYAKAGRIHLFKREYLSDPAEGDTHPLGEYEVEIREQIDKINCYRVISIDNSQGTGQDNFAVVETGENSDEEMQILSIKYNNTWNQDRRIEEAMMVIRRRTPNKLVIQRTSESIAFIEQIEKAMRLEGIKIPIVQPTWSKSGDKNGHIYGWLQPRFDAKEIVAKGKRSETAVKKYDVAGVQRINDEAHAFDFFSDRNMDDVLECLANCVKYSQPFKGKPKIEASGNHIVDQVRKAMLAKTKKSTGKYNRTRLPWR
jgi:hypothetical protein